MFDFLTVHKSWWKSKASRSKWNWLEQRSGPRSRKDDHHFGFCNLAWVAGNSRQTAIYDRMPSWARLRRPIKQQKAKVAILEHLWAIFVRSLHGVGPRSLLCTFVNLTASRQEMGRANRRDSIIVWMALAKRTTLYAIREPGKQIRELYMLTLLAKLYTCS